MKPMNKINCQTLLILLTSQLALSACQAEAKPGADSDGSLTNYDSSDSVSYSGTLVINEIVAKPVSGNDWIELYVTEGSVDLSEYSLVDDDADHEAQSLPDVVLSAGDYLVIEAVDDADDVTLDSGYYVTFKLGSDDAVTLYQDGVAVDSLDWQDGDADEGYSYGLLPDGTGDAQTLSPTQGASNEASDDEAVELDTIVNNDAQLRINEIVAQDADGGYDWLELYVTGSSSVNLSDYTLADESSDRLSLPNVTLAAGEFYRIYATTDTLDDYETVAFKLGGSDEVSLYEGDDLIDKLEWSKGDALINYSYGRYPDGSDGVQTLTPTAAAGNAVAERTQLLINEVVANDANGGDDWFELYNNSDESIYLADYAVIDADSDEQAALPDVTLGAGEYRVIYATETDPGSDYVPFKLGNSDELSLIYDDETVDYLDWDASDVPEGYSYGLSPDGSWVQDTLEPTAGSANEAAQVFSSDTVESVYITLDSADWSDLLENAVDETYYYADVSYKGVTLEDVAFRAKGNSSLDAVANMGSERYSFKVDMNEYVDGQKLLGLKKFVLNNSYNDPSYLREYIAYELMDELDVPAPRRAFVNLYINDERHGLYLMVEAVDGEFLEDHYQNAEGDMYKPDGTGSDLLWISDSFTDYSGVDVETNDDTTDHGAFINFIDELNYGEPDDVIDYDTLMRYMAVSTSLSNLDSYHGYYAHNYYFYEQDGVFTLLPWDFNESFGTFDLGCSNDLRELYIDEPTSVSMAERPLIEKSFASDDNLASYHGYLQTLIDGALATNSFESWVDEMAALIREDVANDPTSFYGIDGFESNLNSDYQGFYGLTSFISYRVSNMVQQLNGTAPSSGTGSGYCSTVGSGGGTSPGQR
ncbi:CotH kinase family protein [Reinekea marinisedimentorum]|uniref:Lamin tail-like protein n=1 Tax=Reinekea marinisedimentorum TaxID=230495 RepID=A0A4R3IFM5_9GAMM|nr:CotH kinase family protein [Reinekea marinisedimentorum]TCS43782.1 lamin tail-like protein [Reinekea marinisedimentorum]